MNKSWIITFLWYSQYAALSIPYPVDKANMLKQVEEEHQENVSPLRTHQTEAGQFFKTHLFLQ